MSKKATRLVDDRCMTALAKIGLEKAAEGLAQTALETSAAIASTTLGFVGEGEEPSGVFVAELTITVKRA